MKKYEFKKLIEDSVYIHVYLDEKSIGFLPMNEPIGILKIDKKMAKEGYSPQERKKLLSIFGKLDADLGWSNHSIHDFAIQMSENAEILPIDIRKVQTELEMAGWETNEDIKRYMHDLRRTAKNFKIDFESKYVTSDIEWVLEHAARLYQKDAQRAIAELKKRWSESG